MAKDSLLGAEKAPQVAPGRDTAALGPSDSSDSGSDMMGIPEGQDTTPGVMTDPPLRAGADIGVDRVFSPFDAEDEAASEGMDWNEERTEAQARARARAQNAPTLPGKSPNPAPDVPDPQLPGDEGDLEDPGSEELDEKAPGRARAAGVSAVRNRS